LRVFIKDSQSVIIKSIELSLVPAWTFWFVPGLFWLIILVGLTFIFWGIRLIKKENNFNIFELNVSKNIIIIALLILFLIILIKTAWIGDDSAITLRTVLNFLHGYGPVFNIDERVQGYTHPLWFLLLSVVSLVLRNIFVVTFLSSIVLSVITIWLLIKKITINFWTGIIGLSILFLSKAYTDFSTSGLENPLAHVLILLGVIFGIKAIKTGTMRDQIIFFLMCSAIYLTRADLLVIFSPFAILVMYKTYRSFYKLVIIMSVSALPVMIWTLFSIFYYGFPFPNTAYAKLGTGIPHIEMFHQGLLYFSDSLSRDPITLIMSVVGIIIGLMMSPVCKTLALGSTLYLFYIISIGGDFMSGRFFTVPLLISVIIISISNLRLSLRIILTVIISISGMLSLNLLLFKSNGPFLPVVSSYGIADERNFYFQRFGLLPAKSGTFSEPIWESGVLINKTAVIGGGLGFFSIYSGPSVHVIDKLALTDPLLARLPSIYNPTWRIGHFERSIPENYIESCLTGKNLLTDTLTSNYYESIRTVTRGQLFTIERMNEILRLNIGLVQGPKYDLYRFGKYFIKD
jgi:arabinofuranosyltransferase